MSSMLKEVLAVFETGQGSLSLQQMAKELKVEPGLLEGMIDYWVRKGKIREVRQSTENCQTCGTSGSGCHGCPFIVQTPRRFELATDEPVSRVELPLKPKPCCH